MARGLAALAVAVLLCFCGLGCGGDDDEDQAATPGTGTSSTATVATTEDDEEATTEASEEPDEDAGDFISEVLEQKVLGQFGRAWETLHPSQQDVVSRSEYVSCESAAAPAIESVNSDEIEEFDEPHLIPGETTEVPSRAVTLRIELKLPGVEEPQAFNDTVHAIAVDGEWRWVLTTPDYEAYKAGECPPPK